MAPWKTCPEENAGEKCSSSAVKLAQACVKQCGLNWCSLTEHYTNKHTQQHFYSTAAHRYVTGTLKETHYLDLKYLDLSHTTTIRHNCVVAIEYRGYIHTTPAGIWAGSDAAASSHHTHTNIYCPWAMEGTLQNHPKDCKNLSCSTNKLSRFIGLIPELSSWYIRL